MSTSPNPIHSRPSQCGARRARFAGLASALVASLLIAPGCEPTHAAAASASAQTAATYPIATPETRDVFLEREHVCEIRAVRYAEVRSRVKGVLEDVAVDDGAAVKCGEALFSVNARELQSELRVAQAAVASAEAEVLAGALERDNTRLLFERNIVAKAELDLEEAQLAILQAKLEVARAEVERASVALDLAQVRAPFAGIVNRVLRKGGSAVAEDELLTTISDARDVHAYFALSEREMLAYAKAAPEGRPREVRLVLVDGSALPEVGTVDATASEVDKETGSLTMRARFANPGGLLKHGAKAKVVFRESVPNALLVPQVATFDVQGNIYAYVLDEANIARARKLTVRCRVGDAFVVDEGIQPGERFVLQGVQRVRDGEVVVARAAGG
jgi:membrane fusion protein (multidrug efflux system)